MATAKAVRRSKADEDVKPRVWSARICPFAERVLFALGELQIDYEPVVISLDDKPPRLLEINPEGKVPVIEDLGEVVYESLICVEYLDDAWESPTGRTLLPKNPLKRAQYKMIATYIGDKFVPKFYGILQAATKDSNDKCIEEMLKTVAAIDAKMRVMSSEGPFFAGSEPSFLDVALLPHVRRFTVLKHFKGFEVPDTEQYERFNKWKEACMELSSYKVIKEAVPDAELFEYNKRLLPK